jgi:predicted ATPase/class 3 adenylate cyclase/DNA-binding CsgD family transcriptional regulator
MSATEWGEPGVTELPTGTVTLLLADVEGSTRLWETHPDQVKPAIALLDQVLRDLTGVHRGVRPVEQGEGDSFVLAFRRASDAVACAVDLQRAPLAPLRLRIGVHTGEIELRDEGNYIGPTINRTARLRDLAHGGQTVMSSATEAMVIDHLPPDVWLNDLGSHPLRDLPRPERVIALCHPDLCNEFPPLRVTAGTSARRLPRPPTSFIGRHREKAEVGELLASNRLVTLTGAGGVGKTRTAVEVATDITSVFPDGVWWVDLASLTDPRLVALAVARTAGLPDQSGRSALDTLVTFCGDRRMLLVLDNCEHLLDACSELVATLMERCPGVTILTTSREPLGIAGEFVWRVPSLPPETEAVELFVERARRARPDFRLADGASDVVTEICRRLDGMPLAVELAAARVRTLTPTQIRDGLHDRFRLLTGGARTAVRRQQTLRASVEWSHALLTDLERILLHRLSVFMNGFDLDAAEAVGAGSGVDSDIDRVHVLDLLSLLVDKSLVLAEDIDGAMRYRLLETVRQYALEKLGESGEADAVRTRHRDHYVSVAIHLESTDGPGRLQLLAWAEREIDNLRAAFLWSRENDDFVASLELVTTLHELWFRRGRQNEGAVALNALLDHPHCRGAVPAELWVRGVADHAILAAGMTMPVDEERAQEALACARDIGDPALVSRCLLACGMLAFYDLARAHACFAEAVEMAEVSGHREMICRIRTMETIATVFAGDPVAAERAASAGVAASEDVGDHFFATNGRVWLGVALWHQGRLREADLVFRGFTADLPSLDPVTKLFWLVGSAGVASHSGDAETAAAIAAEAITTSQDIGGFFGDTVYTVAAQAALLLGDGPTALAACETAWAQTTPPRRAAARAFNPMPVALLATGDVAGARRWVDEAVDCVPGYFQAPALLGRALIGLAEGSPGSALEDVCAALTVMASFRAYLRLPDVLESLARVLADDGEPMVAVRLLGGADGARERSGEVRWPHFRPNFEVTLAACRDALSDNEFDALWAEGKALSPDEIIAYALRGRGRRRRASSGWSALTRAEAEVVRLVADGLTNKDIGARLFVSPRTVQTHLTHVYAKLGVSSRVQLAQQYRPVTREAR